jgi:hypothetical protein
MDLNLVVNIIYSFLMVFIGAFYMYVMVGNNKVHDLVMKGMGNNPKYRETIFTGIILVSILIFSVVYSLAIKYLD